MDVFPECAWCEACGGMCFSARAPGVPFWHSMCMYAIHPPTQELNCVWACMSVGRCGCLLLQRQKEVGWCGGFNWVVFFGCGHAGPPLELPPASCLYYLRVCHRCVACVFSCVSCTCRMTGRPLLIGPAASILYSGCGTPPLSSAVAGCSLCLSGWAAGNSLA